MSEQLRKEIYDTIFEAETPRGKLFDVALLLVILASVVVIMLDSIDELRANYGPTLVGLEWVFTGLFTIEYLLRLYCVRYPRRYALSFFGIVDLLAILPTYLGLIFGGAQSMVVIRALRLLRVFRIFKLARFLGEADTLARAMKGSLHKLVVFLVTVVTTVLIVGTTMYLIEGAENEDVASIPQGVYWAIVTVTTVGYGDITPDSAAGMALASILMIIGFAIIAVPTGIVTAELVHRRKHPTTEVCPECLAEGHDADAVHCKFCGAKINPESRA